jgi:site-specific recombinase XerC
MKQTEFWIQDWKYGVAPAKEREISAGLLRIFRQFWDWAELDQKSKTTQQRYSNSLHALGGWAVEMAAEDDSKIEAFQILVEATSAGDGPLIYWDREEYQKELDTVCRKLYKFLMSQC